MTNRSKKVSKVKSSLSGFPAEAISCGSRLTRVVLEANHRRLANVKRAKAMRATARKSEIGKKA
jgi:hypothetical protein